jgi:hypothetical protein
MKRIAPIGLSASAAEITDGVMHVRASLESAPLAIQVDGQIKISKPTPQPKRSAKASHNLLTM